MSVPYDVFTAAFLDKVEEYDFVRLATNERVNITDGYLHRAMASFKKNCKYDFSENIDDENRCYTVDVADEDLDEIVEIVSEGMLVQWLKPFLYKQENLESVLNTRDFTTYSPAELLSKISNTYNKIQKDYINMIREYSYNHSDLSTLHI